MSTCKKSLKNETQGWARAAAAARWQLPTQTALTSLPPWTPGEHDEDGEDGDDPDEDEGKDVNFHPPALPLLGLCGGPCPSRAPVQLPQVEPSIFQVILPLDNFSVKAEVKANIYMANLPPCLLGLSV